MPFFVLARGLNSCINSSGCLNPPRATQTLLQYLSLYHPHFQSHWLIPIRISIIQVTKQLPLSRALPLLFQNELISECAMKALPLWATRCWNRPFLLKLWTTTDFVGSSSCRSGASTQISNAFDFPAPGSLKHAVKRLNSSTYRFRIRSLVFCRICVHTTEIAPIRVNSGLLFIEKERAFIHLWTMGGNDPLERVPLVPF